MKLKQITSDPGTSLAGAALAFIIILALPMAAPGQDADADAAANPDDATIRLQFPNNPVSDILGIYELLTGKSIVKDTRIFDGKSISLVTAGEITVTEAIGLIESSLQINGYILIKEMDSKTVRVTIEDANLPVVSEELAIHNDIADLPEGRSIASIFMRLEHLDPVEATSIFWTHAGLNEYGRLTAVSNPPGLLITENTSMIRQFARLKDILDVPQGESQTKTQFYELEHADAVVIGQILIETFKSRKAIPTLTSDTIGDNSTRTPKRRETKIEPRIVADDRLNRIMVVSTAADQVYCATIIEEFDQPIKVPEPLVRQLEYVFVDEIIPVLVDILQDTGTGSSMLPDGNTVRSRLPAQASGQASTLTGRVRRGVQRRETVTTEPGGHGDQLINPTDDTAPVSVLVGKTRLVADIQANSLLAFGPEADIEKINSLLDKLDKKPPQVYLATVIGQLTLGDELEFGIDYLSRFKETGDGGYAGSILTNDRLPDLQDIRDNIITPPIGPLKGLSVYGQIGDNLDVFVRALEATDKFQVLSRPSVFAANNKKAVITSGQRIPVPIQGVTDLANPSAISTSIEFQDVVLKLEVIPLINGNKDVSLTIAQVNDTVVGEQEIGENLVVPVIGTEKLTTAVTVPNRTTIVLGGLITEGEEKVTTGVPFVSRIPVLGHAFKNTRKKIVRKELVIFIQPIIVEDAREIENASIGEDLRSNIGSEAFQTFPDTSTEEGAIVPPNPRFLQSQGDTPPTASSPKPRRRGIMKRLFHGSERQ